MAAPCGEKKAPLSTAVGAGTAVCPWGGSCAWCQSYRWQRPPDAEGSRAISAAWRSMRRGWAASANGTRTSHPRFMSQYGAKGVLYMRHQRAYSRRHRGAVTFAGSTRTVTLEISDFERLEQLATKHNVGNATLGRHLAMPAATFLASSLVMSFAAARRPGSLSKMG